MIYAFIPARSGSTRLKNKNILLLNNKRLFEWSIELAGRVNEIDKIIFSTDSNQYISYANSLKLNKELIIDKRKNINASSNKKIFDYLKGDFLQNNDYLEDDDYLLMLLPTQPFRSTNDVKNIISLNNKTDKNVFSARKYSFPVSFAFEIKNDKEIKPLISNSPLLTGNTRSQDQKNYFHPDGSIYLISIISLKEKSSKSIYNNAVPFELTSKIFIDIDDEEDFKLAQQLADIYPVIKDI